MNFFGFFARGRALGLPGRRMAAIIGLAVLLALCEASGIAFLLPIIQYIQANGDVAKLAADYRIWRHLVAAYGAFQIEISLAALLATSFAFVLCRQAIQFVQLSYHAFVRNSLTASTRARLFDAFLASDIAAVERVPTGRLVNEFTIEAEGATVCITQFLQLCALIAISLVYACGLLMLSIEMTLVAAVLMGVTAVALRGLLGRALTAGQLVTAANQEVGGFLVERLRALRLIRLSSTERAERAHAQALLGEQCRQRQHAERLNARLTVGVEPIFVALVFGLLWFAIERLAMPLSEIGLFLVVALRLLPIGKDMMRARQNLLQSLAGLNVIEARLAALGAVREDAGGAASLSGLVRGIEFQDITFNYPGPVGAGVPALTGVRLLVPAGRITALVGPSGAGKSTLVDLLPQLRSPSSGEILFDGVPATALSRASLRASIAYLPQSPQIFDVTATEHIRYGQPEASDAEVMEAARLAGALDFILRLPEGFATRLGEGGGRLSGGQRQRLDLSRALVRGSPILILDEPTSALDADAETAFKEALLRIRAERACTILMIGHRLSTVVIADRIVVMDKGRVVDIGTHRELMTRGGWYARAWTQQVSVPSIAART